MAKAGDRPIITIPEPICPFCEEPWDENHETSVVNECPNGKCEKQRWCKGSNNGSSSQLGYAIAKNSTLREDHELHYKKKCLQAHHLICSEAMNHPDWAMVCWLSGYNINCYKNGVNLPSFLEQACHARIPLHKGPHDEGYGGGSATYPNAVKKEIESVLKEFKGDDVCTNKETLKEFVQALNDSSKKIFHYISNFIWTITWDGFDYELGNPIGCANVNYIPEKQEKLQELLEIQKLQEKRKSKQNDITQEVIGIAEVGGDYIQAIEDTREQQENILKELCQNNVTKTYSCNCKNRIHSLKNKMIKPKTMIPTGKYILEISK